MDWEEIAHVEHFSDIYIKRFKAQEVQAVKYGDNFRFPLARGELTQPGPIPRCVRQRRLCKQIAEEQVRNFAEADVEIREQRE